MAAESNDFWLFTYSPSLDTERFLASLSKPESDVYTASVANAWLSWDVRRLPYYDPTHPSLIIAGVNDDELPEKARDINTTAYRTWLHQRCCPGRPFTGDLPPNVEGSLKRVSSAQLERILLSNATFGQPSLSSSPRYVLVECKLAEKNTALPNTVLAHTLVHPRSSRAPHLQPTFMNLMLHVAHANCLPSSHAYVAHLNTLRPYRVDHRLARILVTLLCLLPAFAIFYAPFALLKRRIPLWAARVLEGAVRAAWTLEGWLSPRLGSGYVDL